MLKIRFKKGDYIRAEWMRVKQIDENAKRMLENNWFVGQVVEQNAKELRCKIYHSSRVLPEFVALNKNDISKPSLLFEVKKIKKSEVLIYEV